MNAITSIDEILEFTKIIKDRRKGYLTNFFLDPWKTNLYIRLKLIEFERAGNSIFICKNNDGFSNLYYLTDSTTALGNDIPLFLDRHTNDILVSDIVGFENNISDVKSIMQSNGFSEYTNLERMSKTGFESYELKNNCLFFAGKYYVPEIFGLLYKYFDPYAEQLPLIEEISDWVEREKILIYKEGDEIQGFLIFERSEQTSYLKYWFVHPDHREKKIGSELLRKFFTESRGTRRQLFWVISSNDNAIKRYEHYGFRKESLKDIVMINRKLTYEG